MPDVRLNSDQRQLVADRACGCCEYCRAPAAYSATRSRSSTLCRAVRGGETDVSNAAYSCQGCNNHKYTAIQGFDVVVGEAVPLYHPRLNRWQDHFAWNDDLTIILGITPTGAHHRRKTAAQSTGTGEPPSRFGRGRRALGTLARLTDLDDPRRR